MAQPFYEHILHVLKSNEVCTLRAVNKCITFTLLYSLKDKKFYIGFTSNLKDRVKVHSAGGVSATKNRRPCKLIFYEGFLAKQDAMRRERYFKTNPGKKSLRLMLRETLNNI